MDHPADAALKDVLVTSRSFAEYVAFFGLDPDDLPPSILDVSAGASSFVAEASARGVGAFAADPAYGSSVDELASTTSSSTVGAAAMVDAHAGRFTFDWYGTPERRAAMRAAALATFQRDRSAHPDRYVPASLSVLPFEDKEFDLALCSHLLFTWANLFDGRFHLEALLELVRVAAEVRVFPLVLQGSGGEVEFLPRLLAGLRDEHGVAAQVTEVSYEFQVGARHALTLRG